MCWAQIMNQLSQYFETLGEGRSIIPSKSWTPNPCKAVRKRRKSRDSCKTKPRRSWQGWGDARDFAQALDVYNDGILVREIPLGGELVELVLTTKSRDTAKLEDISDIPMISRDGSLVKIGQVADVSIESAPNQLLRQSGRRVVTIELRLHESIPLEVAIKQIKDEIVDPFNLANLKTVFASNYPEQRMSYPKHGMRCKVMY